MPLDSTPWWKYVERDLDDIPDAPPYPGLKPGTADDFANLRKFIELNNQTNTPRPKQARRNFGPMPARGSKRGRMAPSRRSTKRKAPRGRKTVKRKAPIRKSTKRKKRKVSAKSIPMTTGTIRQRHVEHTKYTAADALYIPMNSIGPKDELLKVIAQSLVLHYMHRVGDYRSNANRVVHTNGDLADEPYMSATWETMRFVWLDIHTSAITIYDLASSTSSLLSLGSSLGASMYTQVKAGRRLGSVLIYRTGNECIFSDVSAGRNVIELSCKAAIKLQNTTTADVGDGITDANGCGKDNALNINRNPLDGLVYNFRNAVPKFKQSYMMGKTASVRGSLDQFHNSYSASLTGIYAGNVAGGMGLATLADCQEFKIPPPAPSTIFSNSVGKSSTAIPVGGHKSYFQSEFSSTPLNSFFDRYFPTEDAQTPPGGTCIIIGLKPKYRNTSDQDVQVQAEVDHTYTVRMSRAKLTVLPMNTILT